MSVSTEEDSDGDVRCASIFKTFEQLENNSCNISYILLNVAVFIFSILYPSCKRFAVYDLYSESN